MRRLAIMALVGALGVLGCGKDDRGRFRSDDEPEPIPVEPPVALACDYCVDTPPATFTGPSNFYRGKFEIAPDCKDPTPLQGIQGFLTEPSSLVDFVRECRITPSDTCETEGKVCAPLPEADFQTCVHHTGPVACEDPYTFRDEVVVLDGDMPFVFTLCCMPGLGPV